MREGDSVDLLSRCGAGQKIVALPARRHFDGLLLNPRPGANVGAATHKPQPEFSGRQLHEVFIGIAAPPTELVIQMSNDQLPMEFRGKPVKQV